MLIGALALAGPGLTKAAPPGDRAPSRPMAFVGAWRVGYDGEGAMTCVIRLNAAVVIGGYQVVAPKSCRGAIERYDELYAWRLNPQGELVLADPARHGIYRFHQITKGVWATDGPDDQRYLMQPVPKKPRR